MKSSFGWVLSGDLGKGSDNLHTYSSPQLLSISPVSDRDLYKFWDLESIGISSKDTKEEGSNVLEEFQDKIKFVDDRYEVQLPWKDKTMKERLQNNERHDMRYDIL